MKNVKNDEYPVVVVPLPKEDGPGFVAYVPDLKGCMSHGDTQAEALEGAADAVNEWITEALASGRIVPAPNSGVEKSMADRNKLIKTIKEQNDTIAGFLKQIAEIENRVKAFSDLLVADPLDVQWPSAAMFSTIPKASKKNKSGQEVH